MSRKMTEEITPIEEPKKEEPLSPSQYFDILKRKAEEAKEKDLIALYNNATTLMNKYRITGQKAGALKLYNFARLCERELEVVHSGFTTYINRQDLDEYIENVASRTVVIIELENYERDIPDDIVDKVALCREKNLFDGYYVVFTDYTGKERKKVEKEKQEKDPILLGSLKIGESISPRLYHIGSWEDQYCDLTLDKMVQEYDAAHKNDPKAETMAKSLEEAFGSYEDFKNAFGGYNG